MQRQQLILPNNKYLFVKEKPISELVRFHSHRRLSLYIKKGHYCASCAIVCDRLILGKDNGGHRHWDLYDQDLQVMLTRGHIVPHSKGGPATFDNLRPLCHICNLKEGSSLVPLIKDIKKFEVYLKGKEAICRSGNPFQNGELVATIDSAFFDTKQQIYCIKFTQGFTYPADKIKIHTCLR